MQGILPAVREGSERRFVRVCTRDRRPLAAADGAEGQTPFQLKDVRNGRTQAQNLEAQEARAPHTLQGRASHVAAVSPLRRQQAAPSCLPDEFQIQLVGRKADIEAALSRVPGMDRARIEIVDAPEVVGMGDKPLAAIRGKPRSSIAVGLGLQKKGKSDAFISAGNTGAVMAASTLL